jgi:hypothetical protein
MWARRMRPSVGRILMILEVVAEAQLMLEGDSFKHKANLKLGECFLPGKDGK